MSVIKYILLLFTIVTAAQSQNTVKGTFPQAAGKEITLKGYEFNGMLPLSQAIADTGGSFTLNYPQSYTGAALLEIKGSNSVIILLNNENFLMHWANLENFDSLTFKNSPENDAFAKGLAVYHAADAKRAGLSYLLPLYSNEPQKQQFLQSELLFQDSLMPQFMSSLPEKSYARYYLNLRRFLADMPQTATRYFDRLPLHEQEFKAIDFSDERLLHSGHYKELLESYIKLMEAAGTQYSTINAATDAVLASLKDMPGLKQDAAEYLFRLFEQRSLYTASEHIAFAMLSDTGCTIDTKREALFEQYRKMAKGNTAPDIELLNSNKTYKKLSDIKTQYKLVIFGAGWCPTCQEEAPKLKAAYEAWKKRGLEIVYISLDTDKSSFTSFTGSFPWVTATDFKSWEGKAARDYFISGTPTMYLLDATNKIVLKPVSVEQVSAWLGISK